MSKTIWHKMLADDTYLDKLFARKERIRKAEVSSALRVARAQRRVTIKSNRIPLAQQVQEDDKS